MGGSSVDQSKTPHPSLEHDERKTAKAIINKTGNREQIVWYFE
jgi:hypothetical protein